MHTEEYRRLLAEERDRLQKKLSRAEGLGRHENLKDSTQELSLYDNHPADLGSENFERGKDLALHEHELLRYRKVLAALERIGTGEYGRCESCGEEIDPARLRQLPEAALCLACQEREEQQTLTRGRPLEEEARPSPYGPSFKDRDDYTGYDGEDAWQDVARYNKLPHVHYEDVGEDEDTIGSVEDTDRLSNEDLRKQLE
jgi:DnaK suppressor protein